MKKIVSPTLSHSDIGVAYIASPAAMRSPVGAYQPLTTPLSSEVVNTLCAQEAGPAGAWMARNMEGETVNF